MRDRRYDSQTRDDIEDLHGEIRRLRKLVKLQKREIARLRKYEQKYPTKISKNIGRKIGEADKGTERKPEAGCGTCGGEAAMMDLGIRKYLICKDCGARKRIGDDA